MCVFDTLFYSQTRFPITIYICCDKSLGISDFFTWIILHETILYTNIIMMFIMMSIGIDKFYDVQSEETFYHLSI